MDADGKNLGEFMMGVDIGKRDGRGRGGRPNDSTMAALMVSMGSPS